MCAVGRLRIWKAGLGWRLGVHVMNVQLGMIAMISCRIHQEDKVMLADVVLMFLPEITKACSYLL